MAHIVINGNRRSGNNRRRILKRKGRKEKNSATFGDDLEYERRFLLWSNADFFLQEAYKTLRTNVNFALTDAEGCKVIAVTSSLQHEGKTITACNLGMSLAELGKRVLLIDADLRRPKLGNLLETGAKDGLTNILVDESLLEEVTASYGDNKNLWVISSGSIPPNPSELLSSMRMKRLLGDLKQHYDYIILDTPPVNMVTDALVLSDQVDGMLFVVKANQSEKGSVIHAIEQLEYANVKVLGTVLNGVSQGGGLGYKRYGYSRYGYSRYGYSRYGYSSRISSKNTGDSA